MSDAYKIFRQVQEKAERTKQYTNYEKEDLIDEIFELQEREEQLQNNWNELKKFVEERIKFLQEEKAEFEEDLYNNYETNNAEITIRRCNLTQLEDVQEKMQELENRKV